MLNAITIVLNAANTVGRLRAAASMQQQGFRSSCHFEWDGGTLEGWIHPAHQGGIAAIVATQHGHACCVGPLWYRGRFGRTALEFLLEETSASGFIDEGNLRGNFALFVRTAGLCLLLNDALGFVRVYASQDRCFYGTSWLATCAYTGTVDVDEPAAVEYVLLGASHSEDTVARGVSTLPIAHAFDLASASLRPRPKADCRVPTPEPVSFDTAVEAVSAHLSEISREVTIAFPGRTRAALSGGFDSRLIVAGLLACGGKPALYVYGAPDSADVRIGRLLARELGLAIEAIDKRVLEECAPEPGLERLVQNGLFFDGLPNDGIHDRGSDQATRLAQTASGYLVLNGGGGEIFRNFFHLPDRSLSAMDVVQTFYRGFGSGVFRRTGALGAYRERLASSIERTANPGTSPTRVKLTRRQVELLYPLFRCHYWMAVNNSVGVRHGNYTTPLVDLQLVQLASVLPLAWKNAGRFESRLIAKLHPRLANMPSSYGFRFSDGPDLRARIAELATCARPIGMRPLINRVHGRLSGLSATPDTITRCRNLLPGEWRLDPLLDLTKLPDDSAFSRALAVEVVWRKLLH